MRAEAIIQPHVPAAATQPAPSLLRAALAGLVSHAMPPLAVLPGVGRANAAVHER